MSSIPSSPEAPADRPRLGWGRVVPFLQPLILVAAFAFVGLLLARQWDGLRAHEWRIHLGWLAASGAFALGGWLLEIRIWRRLLELLGGRLDEGVAIRIWFTSAIMRYVPGRIWQPLGMTAFCRERGIQPQATLASISLLHVVHVLAVVPIALLYLATRGRVGADSQGVGFVSPWWPALVAAPLVLFLARPHWMLGAANYVLTKLAREPLPLRLSTGQVAGLLGISLGSWAFWSSCFLALAGALALPSSASFWSAAPRLAVAFPVAYAVGFLSLITPSGLVVREGVLVLILGPTLGAADAIVIALAMRVWEIALEIVISSSVIGLPLIWRAIKASP